MHPASRLAPWWCDAAGVRATGPRFQGFLSAVNLTLHSDGKPPVDHEATPDTVRVEQGFPHDRRVVHPEQQFIQASLRLIGNHRKGAAPGGSPKLP